MTASTPSSTGCSGPAAADPNAGRTSWYRDGGTSLRNNRFTAICALAAALGSVTACEGWGTGPGGRHAPHSIDDIPPVELWVFGGPLDVALAPYFRDPNGDSLRFSLSYGAHPSDAMEASLSQDFATITPIWSRGTGAVTVTATDPGGLYAQQTFAVRVLHTSAPLTDLNRPRATAKLPPMQLQLGGRATIRLADYFYLPWPTEWEITSSSSSLAASVSEDIPTLEGRRVGPARVTVRATNDRSGGGARAAVRGCHRCTRGPAQRVARVASVSQSEVDPVADPGSRRPVGSLQRPG